MWGWQGAPTASEGATEPIKEFISTEVADTPYKVCGHKGVWAGNTKQLSGGGARLMSPCDVSIPFHGCGGEVEGTTAVSSFLVQIFIGGLPPSMSCEKVRVMICG